MLERGKRSSARKRQCFNHWSMSHCDLINPCWGRHANIRCLTVLLSEPARSPNNAKVGWNSSVRDSGATQIRCLVATLHCRRLFAVAARTCLCVGTSQTPFDNRSVGIATYPSCHFNEYICLEDQVQIASFLTHRSVPQCS